MTVPEAAAFLGVKPSTVRDLVAARKLAHYRIGCGRGKIVLDRADVERFKLSCRVEAEAPGAPQPACATRGLGLSVKAFREERRKRAAQGGKT